MMRRMFGHAWTAAVLGLLTALLVLPGTAMAAEAGTLSGTAYGTGGVGVEDVSVLASYQDAEGLWQGAVRTYTDAQGRWSMELPPGSYKVLFEDDRHGRYLNVHHGGADEFDEDYATVVEVEPGLPTSGVDVQLQPAARVEGFVSTRTGGPIGNVEVAALRRVDTATGVAWRVEQYAYTGGSGLYLMGNLESGTYRLLFTKSGYLDEYHDGGAGADELEGARDLVLTAGVPVSVDAALEEGSSISGTLAIPADGPPLAGFVNVLTLRDGRWETAAHTLVAGDYPHYRVGGLREGSYKIVAGDFNRAYAQRYYPLSTTPEGGQSFVITDRSTALTGVDFDLGLEPADPQDPPVTGEPPATPPPPPPSVDPPPADPTPVPPAVVPTPPLAEPVPQFVSGPRLRGVPRVGKRLRVVRVAVAPATATVRYRWLADGRRIRGAKASTLRLTRALVGRRISVRLVATGTGGRAAVVLRSPVRVSR